MLTEWSTKNTVHRMKWKVVSNNPSVSGLSPYPLIPLGKPGMLAIPEGSGKEDMDHSKMKKLLFL